jgi:hypothetical protein
MKSLEFRPIGVGNSKRVCEIPTVVDILKGENITALSCNETRTIVSTFNGALFREKIIS